MKYFRSQKLVPLQGENTFEIIEAGSVAEAKSKGADFIDLAYVDYLEAYSAAQISSLDAYHLSSADCLFKLDGQYHFYQLSQKAFLSYLAQLKMTLQTQDEAVLVGDELTISQFLPALTKIGYSKFTFIVEDTLKIKNFVEKIQRTFLGLSMHILSFSQISAVETVASFLLVDVDHSKNTDLIESLTYFNFLKTGSVFFDVRSALGHDLAQEAQRAQMIVIDSAEYEKARLDLANLILTKNIK